MRTCALSLVALLLWAASVHAAEGSDALARIESTGQINLGFREAEPPMSFRNDDGEAVGYSLDLCDRVVAVIKRELGRPDIAVNHVPITAESRFDAIEAGEIDILCGATTKTLSRSERVGFSQLTFVTGATLLSLEEQSLKSVRDLRGKRVAVVDNTTTIEALRAALDDMLVDAEIVAVATANEGMDLLDQGEVDAFTSDQVVLIGQVILRGSDVAYYLSEELFSFEPFALAMPRGDAALQLMADRALSQLNRSGQILDVYNAWFGRFAEEPPVILKALYQLNSTPE